MFMCFESRVVKFEMGKVDYHTRNKGIGDAGSTADFTMLWSAIVCLGLGLL